MKFLIDQNISQKIIPNLKNSYPNSAHVVGLGLENSTDKMIWEYAKSNNFIIVTFDADFYNFSVVWGFPPKIIWIRAFNQTTSFVEELLIDYYSSIQDFLDDENLSCLELKQLN
jgi:predicted nuclease of predicted toxin-antitoxin system